jgi:hypothetical protein
MPQQPNLVALPHDALWYEVQAVNLLNRGRSATSDEYERIKCDLRELVRALCERMPVNTAAKSASDSAGNDIRDRYETHSRVALRKS